MAYTTPPALSLRTRTPPRRLAIATLLAALAGELQAFELGDPFATGALTPPPPALIIDGAALPCQPLAADVPYGLLEVVDLALCRNPTTREVWSATRLQAAQVGLAQADFLPALDGRVAAAG
jgi:outer membrane protein